MLKIVHMKVNGKDVELAVDERESLLDTLRQRMGLTSVKKGCEVGECGACTVLVNGEAIDSCIYMTLWAEGKSVMTVEGLKGPTGNCLLSRRHLSRKPRYSADSVRRA